MYPPPWIEPFIFQPQTFNQVSTSSGCALPSEGASVPRTTRTPDPPYLLTAVNSCHSVKKQPCWGALTYWQPRRCSPTAKVKISLLSKCINCQSSLHNVLSCVLSSTSQTPQTTKPQTALYTSGNFTSLSSLAYSAYCQWPTKWGQNEAEAGIMAQETFPKGSTSLAASRYTGYFVAWEFL